MQAHRLFYPAFLWPASLSYLSRSPPASSTRASMIARLQHLLARTLRVHHDDLEEVLEVHVEELDQRLAQFRAGPARARFKSRNIVLANARVVRQFALCQALLLAHRPQPGCSNLDIHLGIITRTRIFVKTCLQKGLVRLSRGPICPQGASSCRV